MPGVEIVRRQPDPPQVRRILDALPDWFGIETANAGYVEDSRTFPALVALSDDDLVGVLLLKHHSPESAEVHLLAVLPELHHHGIGSALLGMAEVELLRDGCRLLQVKTLGPSYADESYARTRDFYLRRGFVPLEEFKDFWDDEPCLIMVKSLERSA